VGHGGIVVGLIRPDPKFSLFKYLAPGRGVSPQRAKISTAKLNFIYNKPCFETAYSGENVINFLQQKLAGGGGGQGSLSS
jgi:hypothetical protein